MVMHLKIRISNGKDLTELIWNIQTGDMDIQECIQAFQFLFITTVRSLEVTRSQKWDNTSESGPTSSADDDVYSIELGAVRHNSYAYAICVRDMPIDE